MSKTVWILCIVGFVVLCGAIGGGCYYYPKYRVWQQKLEGEAMLQKAESTRRTVVLEAQAKRDAAKMLAEAEIERMRGLID